MLNRLLISNRRIPTPFKMMIARLLLAVAGAWVISACAQQPAPNTKSSAAAESSPAVVSKGDPSQRLATDLSSAIEQVANNAIPAGVPKRLPQCNAVIAVGDDRFPVFMLTLNSGSFGPGCFN